MPYKIKKSNGGFKVCKKKGGKCFSKKPLSKKKAKSQMAAILANESFANFYYENNRNFLLERNLNLPIISIDIQPFYNNWCKKIMPNFTSFLNHQKGEIICYYNGSDVGVEDTKEDLANYFIDWGLSEEILEKIKFKEKGYAFFRNWMDKGVKRSDLIKAIRYMVMSKKYDSDDVSEDEWMSIFGEDWDSGLSDVILSDKIYIPYYINFSKLKSLGGCYICGGAEDECLSEFRFLLEAFNIKYKLVKSLIY